MHQAYRQTVEHGRRERGHTALTKGKEKGKGKGKEKDKEQGRVESKDKPKEGTPDKSIMKCCLAQKKTVGHEPSANAIEEAGWIFAMSTRSCAS